MQFEYLGSLPLDLRSAVDWNNDEGVVAAIATSLQRHPVKGSSVKTMHGEFRVSYRPLTASEVEKLGLSPQMQEAARFAVHIEGCWRFQDGKLGEVVLELQAATRGEGAAKAYVSSCRTWINLSEHDRGRIKQEILSALQLLDSKST